MMILPLTATKIGIFPLLASSDRVMSIPSNDDRSGISSQMNDGSMQAGVRFLEEVVDSIETRSSPPKGQGVFATRTIPKGTFLCRYMGELLTNDEQEERYPFDDDWPEYCLRISPDLCIDGVNSCHWSRFVNHHEHPNVEVRIHGLKRSGSDSDSDSDSENEPFAYFQSIRTIDVGEELSFDYGPVYFHVRGIVPAPGTESRTVKEYNSGSNIDEEKEEEVWKKLDLPEIPVTVEDIRMIANASTTKTDGGENLGISSRQKKSAFVRALDYFGAIEWIDDDSFFVTIKRTPDGDANITIEVDYPSVRHEELADFLEDVISFLSPKK